MTCHFETDCLFALSKAMQDITRAELSARLSMFEDRLPLQKDLIVYCYTIGLNVRLVVAVQTQNKI